MVVWLFCYITVFAVCLVLSSWIFFTQVLHYMARYNRCGDICQQSLILNVGCMCNTHEDVVDYNSI